MKVKRETHRWLAGGSGWKKVGLGASQSWDGHGKGKSAVETLKWNEWKDGEGRNPVNAEIPAASRRNSGKRDSNSRIFVSEADHPDPSDAMRNSKVELSDIGSLKDPPIIYESIG